MADYGMSLINRASAKETKQSASILQLADEAFKVGEAEDNSFIRFF